MALTAPDFSEFIRGYVRTRLTTELGLSPDGRRLSLETIIERMVAEADRGCGLSYDLFLSRFSSMLDQAYPVGSLDRVRAIEIAAAHGGYASPAELAQAQDEMAESGCCTHGLDPQCCPCGCGDYDAEW